MHNTSDEFTPQDGANDDGRRYLGAVTKRDDYVLPEHGWSSLGPKALDYLRDPKNLAPRVLQELVNKALSPFGGRTTREDPEVLAAVLEAFGSIEIDLGDEAYALYPYGHRNAIKTFHAYFRARTSLVEPPATATPPSRAA